MGTREPRALDSYFAGVLWFAVPSRRRRRRAARRHGTGLVIATSLALTGMWASGCDSHTPEPGDAVARTAPHSAPAEKVTATPPSRGRLLGGGTVLRIVEWPDADSANAVAVGALDEAAKREVKEAPVPVMMPDDPELLASAVVTRGAHWAAASMAANGHHVSVQMSGQAKVYAHIKPTKGPYQLRGHDAFVTHNEGIWVASWIEHGVAYNVELECADLKDAACQDREAVIALAEGLTFVGGAGEGHR